MNIHNHKNPSSLSPRRLKSREAFVKHIAQRPSREEEKRIEQNYFMRRVIFMQRVTKKLEASSQVNTSKDETRFSSAISQLDEKMSEKLKSKCRSQENRGPVNISSLSNMVLEMNDYLTNMPDLQRIVKENRDKNKKKLSLSVKNRSREISLYAKSLKKSAKIKNYVIGTRKHRVVSTRPQRPETTLRTKDVRFDRKNSKENLESLKIFFQDFQEKSRNLLRNLEKNVLGD